MNSTLTGQQLEVYFPGHTSPKITLHINTYIHKWNYKTKQPFDGKIQTFVSVMSGIRPFMVWKITKEI